MKRLSPTQQGFAAIAAIFLIVVLAALGAFMVTFSNTQQLTSAQDMQGSRAYWAARAGLEWGIGKVSAVGDPSAVMQATCTTTAPISIDTFSVSVTCGVDSYLEAGATRKIVHFRSTATTTNGSVGSVGYIERSLSASMER